MQVIKLDETNEFTPGQMKRFILVEKSESFKIINFNLDAGVLFPVHSHDQDADSRDHCSADLMLAAAHVPAELFTDEKLCRYPDAKAIFKPLLRQQWFLPPLPLGHPFQAQKNHDQKQ